MIRFNCVSCGMSVSAPEDCAGRSTKCPKCGQPISVPRPFTRPAVSPITGQKPGPGGPKAAKKTMPQPGRGPAQSSTVAAARARPAGKPLTRSGPSFGTWMGLFAVCLLIVFTAGGLAGYALFRHLEGNKPVHEGVAALTGGTDRDLGKPAHDLARPADELRGQEKVVQPDGGLSRSRGKEPKPLSEEVKSPSPPKVESPP